MTNKRGIKKISVEGETISDHTSFFVFKDLQMEIIWILFKADYGDSLYKFSRLYIIVVNVD